MPNYNWSRKSRERQKAMALVYGKKDDQGILPYCRKCPLVETCENVFYNAANVIYVFCADNPRERRG